MLLPHQLRIKGGQAVRSVCGEKVRIQGVLFSKIGRTRAASGLKTTILQNMLPGLLECMGRGSYKDRQTAFKECIW